MDFSFTDEQDALRRAVRDAFADGRDDAWTTCRQLGLPGLAIAEEHGGAGAGWVEVGVALDEAGRVLAPAPLLSTTVVASVLERCGHTEHLAALASGELVGALALDDVVLDAPVADVFLVARDGTLALAEKDAAVVVALPALDQTRPIGRVEVTGATTPIGDAASLDLARELAAVAISCESVGAARHCLEMTVEHLKTRVQFGKPIGSFQALKHRVADLAVEVEAATSAAYYAAWAAADAPDELPLAASVAKAYCTATSLRVAGETIQLTGGIGFTWEHAAHRYFKRAKANERLFGEPAAHRRAMFDRLAR